MSKVERKALVFAVDDNTYIPAEITENTSRRYSCGVVGKSVLTGLTYEEILNCPALIAQVGVSEKSPEFVARVEEFWSDWSIEIPISRKVEGSFPNALIIDGSFETVNGKTVPIDVNEWIAFNIMMKDSSVGKTDEDYESLDQFDFFMFDVAKQEQIDNEKVDKTRKVTMKLAEILGKDNAVEIVRQILINSKEYSYYDITQMSDVKMTDEIFNYSRKHTDSFLKIAQNKDLSDISLANELIMAEIISDVGGTYFNDSDKIGGLKEVVLYLRNPAKDVEVQKLKSLLEDYKLRDVIS